MPRARFLADTSAFARLSKPSVSAAFAPLIAQGQVALCGPVCFELGFSARSKDDYESIVRRLDAFEQVPTTDGDHRRAIEIQRLLAAKGQHRALSLVDALVSSTAVSRGLTVLHYDADFELVADVSDLSQQWIVESGTAD